jgi:hypothetical protein
MQQSSTLVNIAMQKQFHKWLDKKQKLRLCIGKRQQDMLVEPVNPDCLSGSSYILSDATRGNGVQTFNMKRN